MFNVYILLRSLLHAFFLINHSYEDTTRCIFRVWVFAGYITIPYNQVSFSPRTQLLQSGIPVVPEQPSGHYSRLATYCHVCLSLRRDVKPFFPTGYTNIYPLRIRLQTILMSSHGNHLFAGQKMASLRIVGSFASWTTEYIVVTIAPALSMLGVTYTVTYGNRLYLLITWVCRQRDACLGRRGWIKCGGGSSVE